MADSPEKSVVFSEIYKVLGYKHTNDDIVDVMVKADNVSMARQAMRNNMLYVTFYALDEVYQSYRQYYYPDPWSCDSYRLAKEVRKERWDNREKIAKIFNLYDSKTYDNLNDIAQNKFDEKMRVIKSSPMSVIPVLGYLINVIRTISAHISYEEDLFRIDTIRNWFLNDNLKDYADENNPL